jgi:hypothetical protein
MELLSMSTMDKYVYLLYLYLFVAVACCVATIVLVAYFIRGRRRQKAVERVLSSKRPAMDDESGTWDPA